jgi:hypothetical protein
VRSEVYKDFPVPHFSTCATRPHCSHVDVPCKTCFRPSNSLLWPVDPWTRRLSPICIQPGALHQVSAAAERRGFKRMGVNGAFHEKCPPRRAVDDDGEGSLSSFAGNLVKLCSLNRSRHESRASHRTCSACDGSLLKSPKRPLTCSPQKQQSPRFRSECPEIGVPTANLP